MFRDGDGAGVSAPKSKKTDKSHEGTGAPKRHARPWQLPDDFKDVGAKQDGDVAGSRYGATETLIYHSRWPRGRIQSRRRRRDLSSPKKREEAPAPAPAPVLTEEDTALSHKMNPDVRQRLGLKKKKKNRPRDERSASYRIERRSMKKSTSGVSLPRPVTPQWCQGLYSITAETFEELNIHDFLIPRKYDITSRGDDGSGSLPAASPLAARPGSGYAEGESAHSFLPSATSGSRPRSPATPTSRRSSSRSLSASASLPAIGSPTAV